MRRKNTQGETKDVPCLVVDKANYPILLMPYKDVLKQKLLHRRVCLSFFDTQNRILLLEQQGKSMQKSWGMPSQHVDSLEASEELVLKIIHDLYNLQLEQALLHQEFTPEQSQENYFLGLFTAQLPRHVHHETLNNEIKYIYLDEDEFYGICRSSPQVISHETLYISTHAQLFR